MGLPARITIEAVVQRAPKDVWRIWTEPAHIVQWNAASDDWHTPRASNDVKPGGKFSIRMEAKDGSMGFDLEGMYTEVIEPEKLSYRLTDGREVEVLFEAVANGTHITETFEAESTNPVEMQKQGWQAILDNFKRHAESAD